MTRSILASALLALALGSLADAQAPVKQPDGLVVWKGGNAVLSVGKFTTDWYVTGGDYRFESTGLHLLNDGALVARFRLADKASCTFEVSTQNRNFFLDVCGESIKVEAVPDAHKYWITIRRLGKHLGYKVIVEKTVFRKHPNLKKKVPVTVRNEEVAKTILLKEGQEKELSGISFSSRRVRGPFFSENQFKDVIVHALVVQGPVKPPEPAAKPGNGRKDK